MIHLPSKLLNTLKPIVKNNSIISVCPSIPVTLKLHQITQSSPLWYMKEEDMAKIMDPPYWGFIWPGGYSLCKYIYNNPLIVKDKRVLNFGCGSSVEGLMAAHMGAKVVTCNDIDNVALAATLLNADLNQLSSKIEVSNCNYIGADLSSNFDLVLAGDVCYDYDMAERVMTWLASQARKDIKILVGDPGRSFLPSATDNKLLHKVTAYDIPNELIENAAYGFHETAVYEVLKSSDNSKM